MDEEEARRLGIYAPPVVLAYQQHYAQNNVHNPLPNERRRQNVEQRAHSSSSEDQDSPRSKLRT